MMCLQEGCCRSVQNLLAAHGIQPEPVTHQLLGELLGLPAYPCLASWPQMPPAAYPQPASIRTETLKPSLACMV